MATLSGNKIKDTYQSLVKFSDNGNITVGAKQLTDGFGNNSPLYISTTQVGIGVTPESGLNLHVYGDAKIGSNLTVIGNLVVEGSTTTVGTDTLTVKDPLIVLANNNTSTDAVDIGFYGKYTPSGTTLYSGLFREALTGKYRLFKDLEDEPITTVNTSGTGYAVATLVSNLEGNVTGNLIGSVTGGTFSGTLLSNVVATTQSSGDNSTKVATTAYVDNQVGLYDTLSEVLANGNTSGANDIIMEDSQKVNYGTGSDLQIYHDATDSYIKNDTGNLIIEQTTDDADIVFKNDNGSGDTIEYFRIDGSESTVVYGRSIQMADNVSILLGNDDDGLIRYDSTANKILYTGTSQFSNDLTVVGDAVFNGTINLDDDEALNFGTSNAFNLRWSTTAASGQGASIIDSGRIFIETNFFQLNSRTGESMIRATSNSDVELYYNDSKKLETTSTGVYVTGSGVFTQDLWINTGQKLFFDNGSDCYISEDTTGRLKFVVDGSEFMRLGDGIPDTITFYKDSTFTGDLIVDTDTLFVDASEDSVGIGLTNPSDYSADELVISVPDDSGMTLVSGTTDTAYIRFADGTAAADQANFISHDHNTNTLTVFSQAKVSIGITEAEVAYFTDTNFYVDKSTTIDDTLTVNGNSTFAGQVSVTGEASNGGTINIGDTAAYRGILSYTGASTTTLSIANSYDTATARIDFNLRTAGTPITALRLEGSGNSTFAGNVQVGSTAGYTTISQGAFFTKGGGDMFTANLLAGAAVSPMFKLQRNDVEKYNIGLDGNDNLAFINASGDAKMSIDSSGDIKFSSTQGTTLQFDRIDTTVIANEVIGKLDFKSTDSGDTGVNASIKVIKQDLPVGTVPMAITFETGVSGTIAERMRIDSSGTVQVRNNLPRLQLYNTDSSLVLDQVMGTIDFYKSDPSGSGVGVSSSIQVRSDSSIGANSYMAFHTDGGSGLQNLERMRIDSSGNVQIPVFLRVGGNINNANTFDYSLQTRQLLVAGFSGTGESNIYIHRDDQTISTGNVIGNLNFSGQDGASNIGAQISAAAAGDWGATSAGSDIMFSNCANSSNTLVERMRIASDGRVFINNTTTTRDAFTMMEGNTSNYVLGLDAPSQYASAYRYVSFFSGSNIAGSIVGSNQTSVSYNTSSDYRLKENVVEMTGALDRVSQLKPSRFNFISDADKTVDGFLAHEVQEIVPEAITGEKDGMRDEEYEVSPDVYEDVVHPAEEAVYETIEHPAVEEELDDEGNVIVEGKEAYTEEVLVTEAKEEWTEKVLVSEKVMGTREVPDYQGIDQSKLVPLLVGAIQEQQQLINDLKNRIETLENN